MCKFCERGRPLVIGKTTDYGMVIQYSTPKCWLMAYGYDVHGTGSNGLSVQINYCPMCGKKLGDD